MARWGTWVVLLGLLLSGFAFGEKITISTNEGDLTSQLEIRNLTLPDGTEVQYYVVKGSPVTVTIDDQQLIADEVEIDFTNKLVRVVGFGTFKSADETIAGDDLVIELEDQTFSGKDVLIVTEAIDVLGAEASRVPGQIDVLSGRFSPCSRCNQSVQDFGFRAKRLELYPGDRLVAFEVTVVIREFPVLLLPILVIPLAPPDRQPRLSITQGTATTRANVFIDLPYVTGPNALGTFSVRYYADILPGEGNLFTNGLLGGRTTTSYLGGGVNHRFYTETGQGSVDFFYVPSFIIYDANRVPTGKTRDEILFRVRYDTAEELSDEPDLPSVAAFVERDDERRQRLVEYGVALRTGTNGIDGTFSTVGFFDLDRDDDVTAPFYDSSTVPLRTLVRVELAPETQEFLVGPFRLSAPRIDLGVFEDQSNPVNRSAALQPVIAGGRLLESHSITVEPLTPWTGFTLSARTDFTGQYYTTQNADGGFERQIDWYTRLDLNQTLSFGNFGVTFVRDINEGETPFLFDSLYNLGNVVRLDATARLDPAPWLSFSTSGGYVFVFENRPDATGLEPITTNLTLFGNTSWFSLSFENTFDPQDDPGTLLTRLAFRSPEPGLAASFTVTHVADLRPTNERFERDNESEAVFEVVYGLPPYVTVDFAGGYTFEPPLPLEDERRAFYQPFEFGLTLGTLDQGDAVPGLRLSYARDLNERETQAVGFEFTVTLTPFEVALIQRFNFRTAREGLGSTTPTSPWQDSKLSVRWRGVAVLELTGYPLIPPELINLDYNPATRETYGVVFLDDLEQQDIDWRLSYGTTRNPALNDSLGGFENSGLEARVSVQNVATPALQFGVELLANVALADDVQPESYLRNLNLSLATSLYGVVGVQGALRYDGTYNRAAEELSTSRLTIGDVAFTVKFFDQLYVSAVFNDVWDFTNTDPAQSPYTFQPELRLVWDRCCWALYASLDTKTGAVSFTLTTPGAEQGFSQGFDSGLTFPRALLDTPIPGGSP